MNRRTCRAILLLALGAVAEVPAALTNGLAAYYSFESDLNDQSGNGRHLSVASGTPEAGWAGGSVTRPVGGTVERTNLLAGAALNLVDEDNDVLKAPVGSGPTNAVSGTFDLGGRFSISAWHYLAPLPSNTSPRYFVFEAEDSFDVSWGISAGSTYVAYNAQVAAVSVTLSSQAWHHVVQVFESDGSVTYLTVYVNGTNRGSTAAATAEMDFDRIVLGDARDSAGDREWDGLLDEVALWTRALDAAEVEELHTRGRAGLGVLTDPSARDLALFTLTADPPHAGSVTGAGLHVLGATISIQASPGPGYSFAGWNGSLAGQPSSISQLVATSLTAFARFLPDTTDTDGDGLTAYEEIILFETNPGLDDTDGDDLPDGDEVRLTHTDPLQSDTGRVSRVEAIFGPAHAGGIALTPVRIAWVDGQATLRMGLLGSTNLVQWSPLPVTTPDLGWPASGPGLQLSVPAPASNTAVYLLRSAPP